MIVFLRASPSFIVGMTMLFCIVSCSKNSEPSADTQKEPALAPEEAAILKLGEQVFVERAQPSCKSCHTLSAVGAVGQVGPNLDSHQRTREQIVKAVSGGLGLMPAQKDVLSPEEIDAVARFIVAKRRIR